VKYKINYALGTGLKLLATIAFTELFIMSAFAALDVSAWMSTSQIAIADALFLSLASSMLILFWVVKPMRIMEERQRAEDLIRKSEKRYLQLFETSPDVIFSLSLGGTIMSLNPAFEKITGWKSEEYLGKPFRSVIHPDDLTAAVKMFEQVLFGKLPAPGEFRFLTKSGGYLVGEVTGVPHCEEGTVLSVFGVARDITERKTAEEALIAEKNRTEAILAAIGDGISIQDTNFRVLYQNQILKDLVGDHIGEFCYRAYERKNDRCEGCPVALSFEDGGVHKAERTAPTDKGPITVENTASPLRNSAGRIVAGIEVVRDITERKKNEDQILLAKQDWEHTFNTIDDMITVHDRDFNIIRANKSAQRILGLPLLEQQTIAKCYRYYHGTESPPEGCPSCNCVQTGLPASFEIFEPHLNSFIEIRAIPRFDSEGEFEGLIHIIRDITERKKIEKEHADYRDKLIKADEERMKRLRELEKFYDLAIGRELKMKELKKEIKNLKIELTKNERSMSESTDSRR
jgi:PAS domain S-box-containing protein